jgi:hypothetical protein
MAYAVLHHPPMPPILPPVYGACAEAAENKNKVIAIALVNEKVDDRSRDFIAASKNTLRN